MGYFDDFQLLNVTQVRNYGPSGAELILTPHCYVGVMSGHFIINGTVETSPMIYLTPAGIRTPNGWDSPAKLWRDNFYIECSGPRVERFFAAFGARNQCRHIFVQDPAPFLALLGEMQKHFTSHTPFALTKATLCFEEFAARLEQDSASSSRNTFPPVENFMKAVTSDPGRKWDFASEAAKCGFSLRHWNRLFTAAAAMSPHAFVASCRIRKAKELLSHGRLPLKAIAAEAGFEGASEFARFFKKNCGMTPGAFRKSRMK